MNLNNEGLPDPLRSRVAVLRLVIPLLWATAFRPAFAANASVVLTSLHSFGLVTNASGGWRNSNSGLVQGTDGNFYGTTENGGTNNQGTVFKISAYGNFTRLYSFTGGYDGGSTYAGLVQGSDGYFYGTTPVGGTNGYGTVFRISTNGNFTSLYSFSGGNDGHGPRAGLAQGGDGNFYGTTSGYGLNDYGTVFKISASGTLTTLHSFTGNNGESPEAGLVQGADGYFYGTSVEGGTNNQGTVFKISANGTFGSLYSFTGGNDGAYPQAGLVQNSDGYFYGTTSGGGTNSHGTVFKISTNGTLTSLHSFTGSDGAQPLGGLVRYSDGYFYGTTWVGGTNDQGTVFRISTNGNFTSIYLFTGGGDGGAPVAGLVHASGGGFYGTTSGGGASRSGTVFRLTIVPAAPVFQTIKQTQGALDLTWSTETGASYQLQYISELNSTNWTSLGPPTTAMGLTLTSTDYVTNGSARFYRAVRLVAPPN
jgi:uncharacterized repeat protein (TIGR03803 family)